MKKIVKGNDFTLKIPVMKMVEGQAQAFPLPACTDVVVQVCNQFKRIPLAFEIDVKDDNVLLARVEGDQMSLGTYAIEVKGKIFGNEWRSNEYPQFSIVAKNADADTEFGETEEGDNSVEMDTAMVILPPSVELSDLINKANDALKNNKETNDTLNTNEEARKEDETLRGTAEQGRVSAEETRVSAEGSRTKAEEGRVSAEVERVKAEQARNEIEIERKKNELTRKDDESKRVAAEDKRAKAEEARVDAESSRANAESERVDAEAQRANAETGRSSAEAERVKAEKKRQSDTSAAIGNMTERINTAIDEFNAHRTEFDEAEAQRVDAENSRVEAEETRKQAEADRVSAEGARAEAEQARADAETKRKIDFDTAIKSAETATTGAEKVNATLTEGNVFEVTGRTGVKKTLDMSGLVSAQSDVARIQESMGAYSDRPDITLVAKETNKAISADGVKVTKAGWAIAEFTAEKGNEYLFKPNVIDGSVCVFAEYITSIETRGIDYTYTYNDDGTIATATATYLGKTHVYTYEWTVEAGVNTPTIKEGDTVIKNLPMTYETKVGTYSPLVSLNADAELPKDGYCRYMSHFKGNSAIKVVVSYKVGVADMTMKVTRDGVLASISTQLGNLSQKEDETRKKIDELHGSYVDLVFYDVWDKLVVDGKTITVIKGQKMRLYPTKSFSLGNLYSRDVCPLAFADVSHLDTAHFATFSYMFKNCRNADIIGLENFNTGSVTSMVSMFEGCSSLTMLNINCWNTGSVTSMASMFCYCSSLTSLNLSAWDTSQVTSMAYMFCYCSSLTSLNLSAWDTTSLGKGVKESVEETGIYMMFYYSGNIKTLDMGGDGWNFVNIPSSNSFYRPLESKALTEWKLGKNFFKGRFVNTYYGSYNLINWTKASFIESIVTNSYDRRANGYEDVTLYFNAKLKGYLSEENIATMTAKGYIIA